MFHTIPVAMLEVSVTLPPWQKVMGPDAVTAGVAGILTVITVGKELLLMQPLLPIVFT